MATEATPAHRPAGLARLSFSLDRRGDGSIIVRATNDVGPLPRSLTSRLAWWGEQTPERVFLAERGPGGVWRTITYGETLERVRCIAAGLLSRTVSAERPIIILSGNSIHHALLALAAMHIGIPYAPVSTAYSLISSDFTKLRAIVEQLTPGLVFAENYLPFAPAIAAAVPHDIEVAACDSGGQAGITPFADLERAVGTSAVAAAHAGVGPDTIAKVLFTSGSTGAPKGVINTQRMLCLNQAMLTTWMPFLADEPPVLLDWLPWNHTFGGNHNFGLTLWNGGTLWIDDGKPMPAAITATVRNLKEVSPTIYFNVPKGFEMLLPHLSADATLRASYLRNLRLNFYSGASLSPHIAAGLDAVAIAETGQRILMVTGYGSTETAPAAIVPTEAIAHHGGIGVPLPGISLKLMPANGKIEARIKGGTVTPGYWRNEAATAAAFDGEGYYCLGDALRFVTPADPALGLVFDGRLAEDFKLATGTWVSVGPLRLACLVALAPVGRDIVVTGHDRSEVGILIVPDVEACRGLAADLEPSAQPSALLAHAAVRAVVAAALAILARRATGSATRVTRAILLEEPPSIDAGEVTDKGSLNQRAVLERRADLVAALYADPPPSIVITPASG